MRRVRDGRRKSEKWGMKSVNGIEMNGLLKGRRTKCVLHYRQRCSEKIRRFVAKEVLHIEEMYVVISLTFLRTLRWNWDQTSGETLNDKQKIGVKTTLIDLILCITGKTIDIKTDAPKTFFFESKCDSWGRKLQYRFSWLLAKLEQYWEPLNLNGKKRFWLPWVPLAAPIKCQHTRSSSFKCVKEMYDWTDFIFFRDKWKWRLS